MCEVFCALAGTFLNFIIVLYDFGPRHPLLLLVLALRLAAGERNERAPLPAKGEQEEQRRKMIKRNGFSERRNFSTNKRYNDRRELELSKCDECKVPNHVK